jgi:GcrA cell cycle regulator
MTYQYVNPWTDEKVVRLKELYNQGMPASKIAHELGFATRNAIIGKVHRLGMFKGRLTHKRVPRVPPAKQPVTHFSRRGRLRVVLIEAPTKPIPSNLTPSEFDNCIPQGQRKTLLELNSFTCRWPIGDPSKAEFFFCGAGTTYTTYCEHHAARARR